MEHKIEKQRFYLSEFREEAAWLSYMHREGWKFVSTDGWKYKFDQCQVEDWTYQLDSKENGLADEDYLQLFSDYGWEYVFQFRSWFYFRKKKVDACEEDLSIFSDNTSKIEMCKRVINGNLLRVFPALLLILISNYLLFFCSGFTGSGFWQGAKYGIAAGSVLVLILCLSLVINQYSRLYKMMKSFKNPL